MKWRTFSIRTLLLVTLGAALFSAGYRTGYQNGVTGRFDHLVDLIRTTITPQTWDDVGGSGSIQGFEASFVLVPSDDPFAPTERSGPDAADPFACPQ